MRKKAVLPVIAILAIVFVGLLLWYIRRSEQAYPNEIACRAEVTGLATQVELFRQEQGRYPISEEGLDILVHPPSNPHTLATWQQYLPSIPNDPWNRPYQYRYPGRRK